VIDYEYKDMTYEVRGHVAVLTMNRPDKLNALSPGMTESLAEALTAAQKDDNVRVVVLTGAGQRGFCSGQDLSGRSLAEGRGLPDGYEPTIADRRYNISAIQSVARAAGQLDKPYIAAVNGAAAGAGMDLASMTDIRFASKTAKFTTAFSRNGLVSGDGGCYYLPRILGMAKALELLWTSRLFDADEALALGYVSRLYEPELLMDETLAFADELANCAPISVQYIKQLAYQSQNADLETSLRMAQYMQTIVTSTEDAIEGPRAFREKRPPQFKGR
jgi:2-(1,2-epoxy-1,2-dihydrophenyl)acetyl-CoA isomerase